MKKNKLNRQLSALNRRIESESTRPLRSAGEKFSVQMEFNALRRAILAQPVANIPINILEQIERSDLI